MIYQSTINSLTEDELSILYFIADRFLSPFGTVRVDYVKMLRVDVVCKMLDVLKPQAIETNQNIFDSLKKKLLE